MNSINSKVKIVVEFLNAVKQHENHLNLSLITNQILEIL